MEGWTDFFVAEVGAAAALAGLLVVAISINLKQIMSFPLLPGRAAQTLIMVGGSLVLASFALLPGQPRWAFGIEGLIVATVIATAGASQLRKALQHRRAGDPLTWTVLPLLLVLLTALPEIIGGILSVAGLEAGMYWTAIGIIVSMVATLENGWVLIIEILR